VTTAQFVERYESTPLWSEKQEGIHSLPSEPHIWKEEETMTYKNTWMTSFLVCLHREWIFFIRDRSFLVARLFQNLILGLVTGTIFWQISPTSYNDRYGVIFSVLVTLGLKSLSLIPIFYDQRTGMQAA